MVVFRGKKILTIFAVFFEISNPVLGLETLPPPRPHPQWDGKKIMLGAYRHEAPKPKLRSNAGTVHLPFLKLLALLPFCIKKEREPIMGNNFEDSG